MQNNINNEDSIIEKILLKYSTCVKETTIKKCIENFNVNKLYVLSKIKNATKYIPCFINRLNGEIIDKADKDYVLRYRRKDIKIIK